MHDRAMYKELWDELSAEKSLILLAGPRQSGKTVFAREIVSKDFADSIYFNWDIPNDKRRLIEDPAFFSREPRTATSSRPLVILDEIHKYRDWKNYLKGTYDAFANEYQFLVTGSGRLEFSRKAGDSLAGRFLKFHLFPFTLAELSSHRRTIDDFLIHPLEDFGDAGGTANAFESLWTLSGFPEPFLKGKQSFWTAWSSAYGQQILRDDVRTVADIRNLDAMETLFALLPGRVASPLSMNAMTRDVQVSFNTIKNWLALFDAFFLTFRISPWNAKISRGILKEKKLYLFHYPVIDDEAARFENLAAVELLRAVESWNDRGEGRFRLHYVRNKEGTEVDFLLANNDKPFLLVETKLSDDRPSPGIAAFQKRLQIPAVQLVRKEGVKKVYGSGNNATLVITAHRWLSSLP